MLGYYQGEYEVDLSDLDLSALYSGTCKEMKPELYKYDK